MQELCGRGLLLDEDIMGSTRKIFPNGRLLSLELDTQDFGKSMPCSCSQRYIAAHLD